MHYDVAAKRLMEIGGTDILRRVTCLDVRKSTALEELPQEQVRLTSNDFCALCTLADGTQVIVLLEFQTRWRKQKLLDMLAYAALRMRRHKLPVVQVMVLFKPSRAATSRFSQGGITFEIQLVKMWEIDAEDLLRPDQPGLWPLAALAKDGLASASKVDKLLHTSHLPPRERSDLLTIFAIFLGMRDKETSQHFIQKRRDLMIESPIYELIKNEGREEGRVEMLRKSVLDVLRNRFDTDLAPMLRKRLERVSALKDLEVLHRRACRCRSIQEFTKSVKVS